MEQLEKDLKEYRSTPSNLAWDRLGNKLEHRRSKFRIRRLRNMSIAAVLVSAIAVVGVMSMFIESYNPNLFATSANFEPIMMEALDQNQESLYDLKSLKILNETYEKLGQLN